jgi:hypothetical protein
MNKEPGNIPLKRILFTAVLLAFAGQLFFCHRNQLRYDQKKLTQEILEEEKQSPEINKLNGGSEINPRHVHKGTLYKENRTADPAKPPVIIDIEGSLESRADLKLSDVASEIKYVRIEPVPDSTVRTSMKFNYHLTDNYIIASNLFGTHLYSPEGRYIRTIVKNEMTGVIIRPDAIMFYTDYTLKGGETCVSSDGDIIYYNYVNTATGEKYIMKYDCSSFSLSPEYRFDPENPDRISGLGEVEMDLNPGNGKPKNTFGHNGMFGGSPEWLYQVKSAVPLGNELYASPPDIRPSSFKNDRLMTIRNKYGDTLTTFARFEKVVNYNKSMARGIDSDLQYEHDGVLHFRPEFNDTVFAIIPPDRMVPLYVFKLGKFKVTMQEGIDPDFDLTGKVIPGEWAETGKYIFITLVRDGYDCPNSRKNKKVKIYHAIFSKSTQKLVIIKGDPFDYNPEILENDLDAGVPVWPSFYMMGNRGEILNSLKGKEIKDRVSSGMFKRSAAPARNKSTLEKLAAEVKDDDDILMIIK